MTCRSCGNDKATLIRTIVHEGEVIDYCRECDSSTNNSFSDPDVYFRHSGQTFENLCDPMGKPIPIMSKRHKKEVMDKLGVSEAGDKVNGAFSTPKSWIEGSRDIRQKETAKYLPMIREQHKRYLDNMRKRNRV